MQTLAVERGGTGAGIRDVEKPTPGSDEALVLTVHVGIDDTDREAVAGTHGHYPSDDEYNQAFETDPADGGRRRIETALEFDTV